MRSKIINILTELRPEFDFNSDVNFIEQGMLDSFDIVSLVVALDDEFNISIDGMDIVPDNFSGIDRMIALLKSKGVSE